MFHSIYKRNRGRRESDLSLHGGLNLQLTVESVPITATVVSSNHVHGEVYWKQNHAIKFVSDLRQDGGFSGTQISFTNITDRHDLTEILLKVALNIKPPMIGILFF